MITNEITKINNTALLNKVESEYLKEDLPNVRVGDTVRLGVEIREGKKTRTQAYEGVIISQKNSGINKTITVRRVMQGIGVNVVFYYIHQKLKQLRLSDHLKLDVLNYTTYANYLVRQQD